MKIKLIDKKMPLPNCWKSCGVNKDAWADLQEGKEIEVKQIADGIQGLVESKSFEPPVKKTKGGPK